MKKTIKNNYKGFTYQVTMTESGWLYEVLELGVVTKKPHIVLYGGRHGNEYTKEEMENMIDEYLKKENIKPSSTCSYFQESYAKGGCFFRESHCCDDTTCPLVTTSELKLQEQVDLLESELDSLDR